MSINKVCKICRSPFSAEYTFREMMFGYRDRFQYYECSGCGCLQIAEIPSDIEKYYPPYYYSFNSKISSLKTRASGVKLLIDELLLKKSERKARKQVENYLLPTDIERHHKILDVGCGKGELICRMYNMGYEDVTGTDKYLPQEINYDSKVKVMRKDLQEIESNSYDLIMMHHVFEHMFCPQEELEESFRILKKGSYLIIRIPIKGFAWEKYKENWVQLDAPRHFFIHTIQSMSLLADEAGFKMQNIVYDSIPFQFMGSELYKRDIPLHDPQTHIPYPARDIFTKTERKSFRDQAKRVNENNTGDQAIFYLFKQ